MERQFCCVIIENSNRELQKANFICMPKLLGFFCSGAPESLRASPLINSPIQSTIVVVVVGFNLLANNVAAAAA